MKLKLNPQTTVAIEWAAKAVAPRTTLEILSHMLVVAKDGTATFTATDLDIHLSAHCPAVGDFNATLPAKILREAVGQSPELTLTDKRPGLCSLDGGENILTLNMESEAEFPPVPKIKGDAFELDSAQLGEALQFVRHTISQDETRYVLCGVWCEWKDGQMTVVATDGRRISHTSLAVALKSTGGMIVPAKAVPLLLELCSGGKTLSVTLSESNCRFDAFSRSLTTKLIEANYPNWRQVLVKANEVKSQIKLASAELRRVAAWARLAQTNDTNAVKFERKDGHLTVSLVNAKAERTSRTVVKAESDGHQIVAAFNGEYLAAVAEAFGECELTWNYTDSLYAHEFVSGGRSLTLMPMRLA